jgi:hypothetical protein
MSFGKLSTVRFGHGQRHGLSENGVTWAALVSEQLPNIGDGRHRMVMTWGIA